MSRFKRYLLIFLSVLLVIASWFLWRISYIANGYTAKYLCSLTFNSGLDPEQGFESYIKPMHVLFAGVVPEVDRTNKQVKANYLGFLRTRTAVWREGCGCTLLVESTTEELLARHHRPHGLNPKDTMPHQDALWPEGNSVLRDSFPSDVNWNAIDRILDEAMKESSEDPAMRDHTLALVVAWKGRIIGERYAEGVRPDTPLGGWSATKSVTAALTGVMVKDHGLDIKQPVMLEPWSSDERRNITVDHLLRMETGLDFEEDYAPLADATAMLYASADMGMFAAQHPPLKAPDQRWSYSSGTSNVLADVLYARAGGTPEAMHKVAYDEFFNRLGITTAIFEHDESDAFVGSSYLAMSARDWLRVCRLYMEDGMWNSERILPEGWVQYSLTPTPNAPDACYGAHIWLNAANDPAKRRCPQLPADAFFFRGFQDQWIVGIPSEDLMLARIGVTNHEAGWSPEGMILKLFEVLKR